MKRILMWCWHKADNCVDELIVEMFDTNISRGMHPLTSARAKMLYARALIFGKLRDAVAWAIYRKLGVGVSTNDYLEYLLEKK